MIIGVDIGNYAVKTSQKISFPSKVSKVGNILKNPPVNFISLLYTIIMHYYNI